MNSTHLFVVAVLFAAFFCSSQVHAGSFTSGIYKVTWQLINSDTEIMFNLTCTGCSGWSAVGYGDSAAAHNNMDCVQVYYDTATGTAKIQDNSITGYPSAAPTPQGSGDIRIISASNAGGNTFFSFARKLAPTVSGNYAITNKANQVYWSYNQNSINLGSQHTARGSFNRNLMVACSAPLIPVNQDGVKYAGCVQLDATRKVKFRWNVVNGNSFDAQIEGLIQPGGKYQYTLGIRPGYHRPFSATAHPTMNNGTDDFVDFWSAGYGDDCKSSGGCLMDGFMKGSSNNLVNTEWSVPAFEQTNGIFKARFTRPFSTGRSNTQDQIISATTPYYLMYACTVDQGPVKVSGNLNTHNPIDCRAQAQITFGMNTTCSDDFVQGACNDSVVDPGGGDGGGSDSGTQAPGGSTELQAGPGSKLTWTPNKSAKTIVFSATWQGNGWAGIGFTKSGKTHTNTNMHIFWRDSAGNVGIYQGTSTSTSTGVQGMSDASTLWTLVKSSYAGGSTQVDFSRPWSDSTGKGYSIDEKSEVVLAFAVHKSFVPAAPFTAFTGPAHDYRAAMKVNLVTGGVTNSKPAIDAGQILMYTTLAIFGFYSCIHWGYKIFKKATLHPTASQAHKTYYQGSQQVAYSPKAEHHEGHNSKKSSPDLEMHGFGKIGSSDNLDDVSKSQHLMVGGNLKGAGTPLLDDLPPSLVSPTKKEHSHAANTVHGIWRARIPHLHFSVADGVIGFVYYAINFYLLFIYKDVENFTTVEVWGYLCTANSLLVALPATRNSVLVWFLGVPFDVAIMYHRWIGRVAIAQGIGHFILGFPNLSQDPTGKYKWGLFAVICMMFIFVSALGYFRRKWFNFFFYSHHVFFAFYFFGSLHSKVFFKYALAAGAVYGLDRLLRMVWGIYPMKAKVTVMKGGVVKIKFPKHCLAHYDVGQYVFLNFPQVNALEWHPFTLASGPKEFENEVDIKGLGNFTKKVVDAANANAGTLWVRCDGPYGQWPFNYARYPNVVLICGGVGVTPCIALLRHIYHINRKNGATLDAQVHRVYWVWSLKSLEEYTWFADELKEIYARQGQHGFPQLHTYIHITSAKKKEDVQEGFLPGRPKLPEVFSDVVVNMGNGEGRACVVVCGPGPMVDEAWDLSTKNSIKSKRFDFHHETFEF